jgi:cyclin K
MSDSQWLFSAFDLEKTPTALEKGLYDEMYDRARGVEFLFRLGSSINM